MNAGGEATTAAPVAARPAAIALALLAALALFRVWFAGRIELQGDEAYYWLWSKHLDIGYYSKGPGIAAIIRIGTVLGGDTERGVRWPAALFASGAGWLLFLIGRRLFDGRVGLAAVVLGATIPLFWAGGFLMTIDPPSVFFWLLAAWLFLRAVEGDGWADWLGAGAAIALGALCKFTAFAQLVSFLLFLVWTRRARPRPVAARVFAMAAVALLGIVPPLLWNARHGWVTFVHLKERGALDQPFRADVPELFRFLLGQAAVLSPFYLAAGVLSAIRRPWRSGSGGSAFRFLVSMIVPLPLFYAALSLNGKSEPNWTAPALALVPVWLAAAWWPSVHLRQRARVAWIGLLLAHAALAVAVHAALLTPAVYGEPPRFRRIGGARDLAAQVAGFRDSDGRELLIGGNYQTAALLAFYLPDRPRTFVPLGPRPTNQFYFWEDYRTGAFGDAALFVGDHPPRPELLAQFEQRAPVAEIWSRHRGRPLRRFHVVRLAGLRRTVGD